MTNVSEQARQKIPLHPLWCLDSQSLENRHHDYLHRGDTYHAEMQQFEVGISVGVIQYDELCADKVSRAITEPRLEIGVRNRGVIGAVVFEATLDEVEQVIRVLEQGVKDLRLIRSSSDRTPEFVAEWSLGWTPDEADRG